MNRGDHDADDVGVTEDENAVAVAEGIAFEEDTR